ncbi:MAG: hypothetical protein COA50_16780 [Flavobacteriaceae bacterium]|nr:MAG: hypothetical protein COA50_16780 [Flavobacteriaceae bacterium]
MKWDKSPRRFFTDEFLNALNQRYKVNSSIQNALRQRLENSAREWYYFRNVEDVGATPREVRHSLNKIARLANELSAHLTNAPSVVWSALVETNDTVNQNRYDLGVHHDTHHYPELGLIGSPAITVVGDNKHDPFVTISVSDLTEAMSELASTADIAAQIIPKVTQGPPPDKPLQKWIADLSNIWRVTLDRPFTIEEHKGEPISNAACFFVEIYEYLSPETPKSRVLTEMRKRKVEEKQLRIEFLNLNK